MNIREQDDIVYVEGVRDFNLDHILDCGQCFRWEKNDGGGYTGVAHGKIISADYSEAEQTLTLQGTNKEEFEFLWRNYFDLDRDYSKIKMQLSAKDKVIGDAIEYGYGIRILNQEKWETLLSFIISQNNNIPRIKKNIDSLAYELGEKVGEINGREVYSLPSPERLASASLYDLAPCRLGYRAQYLIDTGKAVAQKGMESLEALGDPKVTAEDAVKVLCGYSGVGPKVANCIALFAMGKMDSFPIDTWVKKVMNQLYGIDISNTKAMSRYAANNFGEYGGIAQQYLFYYITHNK